MLEQSSLFVLCWPLVSCRWLAGFPSGRGRPQTKHKRLVLPIQSTYSDASPLLFWRAPFSEKSLSFRENIFFVDIHCLCCRSKYVKAEIGRYESLNTGRRGTLYRTKQTLSVVLLILEGEGGRRSIILRTSRRQDDILIHALHITMVEKPNIRKESYRFVFSLEFSEG